MTPTPSGVNNGTTARIRDELAKGPATTAQVARRISMSPRRVYDLIQRLCNAPDASVYVIPDTHPREYTLTKPIERRVKQAPVSKGSGQIAGPITIGSGHRWGATRL